MGLVLTSVGELPEYWRAQAVDGVRIYMDQIRAVAVTPRTDATRAPAPAKPPTRPRQHRRRPQPAAQRPRWYLG
jgi:hypothetical protein